MFKPKYWAIILFKYIYICFILLFTSSSPCRKDQFAVLYFSTGLIVSIQVYNWEIRHHSLVCCLGFAESDILNILKSNTHQNKILDLRYSSYSIKDLCIAFFQKGKFFTFNRITGYTIVFLPF